MTVDFSIFAVIIFAFLATPGEGGFALNNEEEHTLLRCFRRRHNSEDCFRTVRRIKLTMHRKNSLAGSITEDENDLTPANEYLCALNDYQNSRKTDEDLVRAVLDCGSCSRAYRSVALTWRQFLTHRGGEILIQPPSRQFINRSRLTVAFDNLTTSQSPESLSAVDIIISRSQNDEIYGKYAVKATVQGPENDEIVVHDTLQATCPAERKRFFVAGLNNEGLHAVRDMLAGENKVTEFSVEIAARRRITTGSLHSDGHLIRNVDLGLRVSAMILHFTKSSYGGVSTSDGIVFSLLGRRRRRSIVSKSTRHNSCHRATYIMNFQNNNHVLRPLLFDIGQCIGSCDRALTASADLHLNATNHALSIYLDGLKVPTTGNPEPTVCCIPVSYRRLYHVIQDPRGILMSTFSEDMVAEYCGWRNVKTLSENNLPRLSPHFQ